MRTGPVRSAAPSDRRAWLLAVFAGPVRSASRCRWAGRSPRRPPMTRSTRSTSPTTCSRAVCSRSRRRIVWRFGEQLGSARHRAVLRRPGEVRRHPGRRLHDRQHRRDEPDAGVSNQFSSSHDEQEDGRREQLRLQIGDPDVRPISADTATYVISYDVTGAMRTFPDKKPPYDEFFWDATGTGFPADQQGVDHGQRARRRPGHLPASYGPAGSTQTSDVDQDRQGRHGRLRRARPAGQSGCLDRCQDRAGPGQRQRAAPRAGRLQADLRREAGRARRCGALSLVVVVGSPIVGVLWWRKNGRDQRYAGLAPGTTPLPGQTARDRGERPRPADPGGLLAAADPGRPRPDC